MGNVSANTYKDIIPEVNDDAEYLGPSQTECGVN